MNVDEIGVHNGNDKITTQELLIEIRRFGRQRLNY